MKVETISVTIKKSGVKCIINTSDFNPDIHSKSREKKAPVAKEEDKKEEVKEEEPEPEKAEEEEEENPAPRRRRRASAE